jgi:CBS domain-containing membrane protein
LIQVEADMRNSPVRKIMTDCMEVVGPETKLSLARRHFFNGLYHHLPVVSPDGVLLGLLSSNDLLSLSCEAYGVEGKKMDAVIDAQFRLTEVMGRDLITIGPDEPVSHAAQLLSEGSFHALPVVDEDGRLLGIVTSTDLIVFLLDSLS